MSGILNRLFDGGVKEVADSVGNVLDKVITNDEERLVAKNELTRLVTDKLTELASFQREVLLAEMNGSILQRSWRPIVMLAFAGIVVYAKFVAPAFHLPSAELDDNFWNLLEIGMGGYVVGRTLEKMTEKVTDNIDLSMLKKKNRKINN